MTDPKKVLILGGGTGGTITANRLCRILPASTDITVIDSNDNHLYQPGLLFVPFGLTKEDFIPQVQDIITVGEFYEKAAGAQIIFT